MAGTHSSRIRNAVAALGNGRRVARRLLADSQAINDELRDTVLTEIPAFSESANPDVLPELADHTAAHIAEVLRLLRGGAPGDFDFVSEHAERRAEQRFPLEATLHAYRCAHRVILRRLSETAVAKAEADSRASVAAIANFAMEYSDAISTIAASAYVQRTRLLAEVDGDQRAELMRILLHGYDESDGRVAKVLRSAGYLDQRQSYCVALAQPVDPAEMLNAERARRMVEAINEVLEKLPACHLIELRENTVTIILSYARRVSGWTQPRTDIARQAADAMAVVGPAALIGVSNDVPSTSHIPTAYREARLALEVAHVGNRVVQFASIRLERLLLQMGREKIRQVLPGWTRGLRQADEKANGALSKTLRAYADADMNVQQSAVALEVHPNTVYARLDRVNELTGLDARSFHALNELLIVCACWN